MREVFSQELMSTYSLDPCPRLQALSERCPSHVKEMFEQNKSFIKLIVTRQSVSAMYPRCVWQVSDTLTCHSAKVFVLYGILHSAVILYHLFECLQKWCSAVILYHIILGRKGLPTKVKDNKKDKCVFCKLHFQALLLKCDTFHVGNIVIQYQ